MKGGESTTVYETGKLRWLEGTGGNDRHRIDANINAWTGVAHDLYKPQRSNTVNVLPEASRLMCTKLY
jgi:IS5 family transposase